MRKFWSLINTIISGKPKQSLPNFLNINNTEINDPIQIAEYFNNHFSTIGKTLANKLASTSSTDFTTYLSNQVSPSIFFNPTCTTEITHIINHLNFNKSCGPDNINAKILKISLPVITPLLTSLCNDCLQYGVFPKCLKIAKVVPIFKSGCNYDICNYRPISILSVFSKIIEKIVYKRTVDFLNKHFVLIPNQYGFRSNISNIHAVLDIVSSCYENIESKQFSGLIFLDLAKAFDTVNHRILLKNLIIMVSRVMLTNFSNHFSQIACSMSL